MTHDQQVTSLGQVVELVMGQAPPSKDCNFEGNGTPFVKVGEFGADRPVIREWTTNPLRMARKTDVLLCVVGATCGKINLGEDCAIGRSVAAIRPRVSALNQYYLYYFMMTLVERLRSGSIGAAQTVISKDMISSVGIPIPPLPEQHRIVALLDEAFDGIATVKANAEKNLQNARALFESHLQMVFTERGEGWVEKRFEEVCERLHQGLNTAGQKVKFYDSGYPIIQTRNIDEGVIELDNKIKFMCEDDWQQYRDKYRPELGDVFFTNIGTIGKTAIVTNDLDYLIHWNIFKIRPRPETITSEFLKYTLDQLTSSGFFKSLQKGGTVDFVTKKMISEALIHLPDIAEQTRVVAVLDDLRTETQRLESLYRQKLTALADLKKSLLHQAFSGQL